MTYCPHCTKDKQYSGLAGKPPGQTTGRQHICQDCAEKYPGKVNFGQLIIRRRSVEITVDFKGGKNV